MKFSGNAVKRRRKELRMTLQDVADLTGSSKSYVWEVERGTVNVSANKAYLFCNALNCNFNYFFNDEYNTDLLKHTSSVRNYIGKFCEDITKRGEVHDLSKFGKEEKPIFEKETPILKKLTFGSDEYNESLKRLGTALEHHYKNNDHHPEHFENGINGMTLMSLVEMFCDWCAASKRTKDGKVNLDYIKHRFSIDNQLYDILKNTLIEMDELKEQDND